MNCYINQNRDICFDCLDNICRSGTYREGRLGGIIRCKRYVKEPKKKVMLKEKLYTESHIRVEK